MRRPKAHLEFALCQLSYIPAGTTTNCSVTVTNSKFINNTGGLNSALYVLCQTNDPLLVPMRCNIDILTSSFEGNLLLDVDGNGTAVVEKGGPHSAVLVAAATASDLTTINANVAFSTRIINVDVPKMVPSADGLSSAPDWSSLEAHNEFLPPPVEVHARVSGCEFIGSSTGGAGVTVTAYAPGVLRPPTDIYNEADNPDFTHTGPNSYVTISSCNFRGHTAGFPAAHIVAPRVLSISDGFFVNNTGALIVLAAENVTLTDTRVHNNSAYATALDDHVSPGNEIASTVKIQPNFFLRNTSVILDRLSHTGNHGRQTGTFTVLYLATSIAYDEYIYVAFSVHNSTFAHNSCDSKGCWQSERALYMYQIRHLQVHTRILSVLSQCLTAHRMYR